MLVDRLLDICGLGVHHRRRALHSALPGRAQGRPECGLPGADEQGFRRRARQLRGPDEKRRRHRGEVADRGELLKGLEMYLFNLWAF